MFKTDRPLGGRDWTQADLMWSLVLWGAALVLLTVNLGGVALRDWDEGYYAQVAKEIYHSGILGWLHPTIWGQPELTKPPLMPSLMAVSYACFGIHEWTARLPGALLSAASVPLLYQVGRELFSLRLTAALGSGIYLTLLPVVRHGRLAMLDGAVVFFFLIALISALRSRRDQRWLVGITCGLAGIGLTKGLMLLLLLSILVSFIALDTPRLLRSTKFWYAIGCGVLPLVLWYGLQGWQRGGSTLGFSLGSQGVDRLLTVVEQHPGPPWYYLWEVFKYTWPWLLFLPWGVRQVWRDRNLSRSKLLLTWGGGYLVAVSLMGTKLPWYIYPLYPALALIIALPLSEAWVRGGGWGGYRYTPRSFPWMWTAGLIFLTIVACGGIFYFSPWGNSPSVLGMISISCAAVGLGTSSLLCHRRNPIFILILLWSWYLALLGFLGSSLWLWELAEDYPVKPVAAIVAERVHSHGIIYTTHPRSRPSLDFYSGHPVQPLAPEAFPAHVFREPQAYYLVRDEQADVLLQAGFQTLDTAAGWSLLKQNP